MIIFYFLFIIGYLFLAIWQPKWALFFLFTLLPTYQIRFKIFSLPTTLLELMIIILFISWLINKVKSQKSPPKTDLPLTERVKITIQNPKAWSFKLKKIEFIWKLEIGNWKFLALAWLAISLIAVFVSPNKIGALGLWRAYFLEPIIVLLIFLSLIKAKKDFNLAIGSLALSALICSARAILQKWFGGGVMSTEVWGAVKVWRATGFFPQPNFLGLYLGPISVLTVGKFIENCKLKIENWRRLLVISYWLLVVIASLVAIIFARSEGAILSVFTGLVFYFLIILKRKQKLIFIIVLLSLLSLLFSISSWRHYLVEKAAFRDLSGQLRLNIWQGTFELIKDRPVFGTGLRGYQQLIPFYQKPFYHPQNKELVSVETHPYPHNLFLTIWSELGMFGLIIFLLIVFQFFKLGFDKARLKTRTGPNDANGVYGLMSAMIVILIHGLVDTPYFKNDLSILFWLIVGLMIVNKKVPVDNLP